MTAGGQVAEREAGLEPAAGPAPRDGLTALRLLWLRRRELARRAGLGLLCGLLLALLLPPRYQGTVRLMPPDSHSRSTNAMIAALTARSGESLGNYASELLGMRTSGALFTGILQSRTVQTALVERFELRAVYGERRLEDARRKLAARTSIAEDRKSGIIMVAVSDRSPHRAAALAHAYVEELDRAVVQLTVSSAQREREFLERRLEVVQQELNRAAVALSEFSTRYAAVDIKEQARAMVEAVATLQGRVVAAEAELKGLEQIYTAENVRVRAARARIRELRQQMEKLGAPPPAVAGGQPAESLYPVIRELPRLGVTYAELYRQVRVQEVVYETLVRQYEMAKLEEAKQIPTVRLLDAAEIPEKRSGPPRTLITLAGGVLFLLGAVALLLGGFFWQGTSSADPRRMFAEEVLMDVKQEEYELRRRWERGWRRLRRRAPGMNRGPKPGREDGS